MLVGADIHKHISCRGEFEEIHSMRAALISNESEWNSAISKKMSTSTVLECSC